MESRSKKDKIRKEHVKGLVNVGPVSKKITEKGRRARVKNSVICTRNVPGKRRRGRQKTRWKDSCKIEMESVDLKEEYRVKAGE